jgi:anaerobic ribonucleoside-triphosphate reductase activating protein
VNVEISRAHYPVTVLGPGRRIGIWFQGCSIGCANCVSRDTWAANPTRSMSILKLVDWCCEMAKRGLDGITISGGEPFDQPQELLRLIERLIQWRAHAGLDFDVLCYSGYPWKHLKKMHADVLTKLDAVIPEPFNHHAMPGLKWRGSANQVLLPLTDRGQRVYASWVDAPATPEMQIAATANTIWMIGIPPSGGMEAITKACADKGLNLKDVSWQP